MPGLGTTSTATRRTPNTALAGLAPTANPYAQPGETPVDAVSSTRPAASNTVGSTPGLGGGLATPGMPAPLRGPVLGTNTAGATVYGPAQTVPTNLQPTATGGGATAPGAGQWTPQQLADQARTRAEGTAIAARGDAIASADRARNDALMINAGVNPLTGTSTLEALKAGFGTAGTVFSHGLPPGGNPGTGWSGGGGSSGTSGSGGGGGGGLDPAALAALLASMKTETPPREPPPATVPRVAGPNVAPYTGQTQAFSRAKDASSRIHGGALAALKDQMTSRGISGSGIEGALTGEMLSDAARYQSGADLSQAQASDDRGWEAEQGRYAGDLTQRGQDLGLNTAFGGFGVQQRGQDINVGQGNSALALSLANLLSKNKAY